MRHDFHRLPSPPSLGGRDTWSGAGGGALWMWWLKTRKGSLSIKTMDGVAAWKETWFVSTFARRNKACSLARHHLTNSSVSSARRAGPSCFRTRVLSQETREEEETRTEVGRRRRTDTAGQTDSFRRLESKPAALLRPVVISEFRQSSCPRPLMDSCFRWASEGACVRPPCHVASQ